VALWRRVGERARERAGARLHDAGRRIAEGFADPPRHVRWDVRLGRWIEFVDAGARVLYRARAGGPWDLADGTGATVVRVAPPAGGLGGVLENDLHRTLHVHDAGGRILAARVATDREAFRIQVDLLPPGRVNDVLLGQAIDPGLVERVRGVSPLGYRLVAAGAGELRTVDGVRVLTDHFAHRRRAATGGPYSTTAALAVEVADNPLPGSWLAGVVVAINNLRETQVRLLDPGDHAP
jgi:hypothetical protein